MFDAAMVRRSSTADVPIRVTRVGEAGYTKQLGPSAWELYAGVNSAEQMPRTRRDLVSAGLFARYSAASVCLS